MSLLYVLPVHNEAAILTEHVRRLAAVLAGLPGSCMLLVENGSRDDSATIARGLADGESAVPIHVWSLPCAGIGYAYDRGIREALALGGPSPRDWLVLTAADLPFGFTDLEQAKQHLDDPRAPLLIGSKAHPGSVVRVARRRAIASHAYRLVRRGLAGMRTGDSQGSLFLRLDRAAELVDLVRSRDFFYSTELVFHAERLGMPIVELPVTVALAARASTVRPLRDGGAMLRALIGLTRRWGKIGRPDGDRR